MSSDAICEAMPLPSPWPAPWPIPTTCPAPIAWRAAIPWPAPVRSPASILEAATLPRRAPTLRPAPMPKPPLITWRGSQSPGLRKPSGLRRSHGLSLGRMRSHWPNKSLPTCLMPPPGRIPWPAPTASATTPWSPQIPWAVKGHPEPQRHRSTPPWRSQLGGQRQAARLFQSVIAASYSCRQVQRRVAEGRPSGAPPTPSLDQPPTWANARACAAIATAHAPWPRPMH